MKHCLAHCAKYIRENVERRARMVVRDDACVICLHPHHTADKCYDRDKEERVCGLEGCKSHHYLKRYYSRYRGYT